MNQMLDSHCIKVIIDMIIFLEFSDEDVVNPDSAIEVIENVASELKLMDYKYKKDFLKKIEELSHDYTGKQKDFVKNLPEVLGIST